MKTKQKDDYIIYSFGKEDDVEVFADTPTLDVLHNILFSITDKFLATLSTKEKAALTEGLIKERIYVNIPKL